MGLLRMAALLAESRTYEGGIYVLGLDSIQPVLRSKVEGSGSDAFICNREYYAILDRITRGEQP